MGKEKKEVFCVGSFNVRGLTDYHKKEELVRDKNRYSVDVCILQETKIIVMAALLKPFTLVIGTMEMALS